MNRQEFGQETLLDKYEAYLDQLEGETGLSRATKKAYALRSAVFIEYLAQYCRENPDEAERINRTKFFDGYRAHLIKQLGLKANTTNGYTTALDHFLRSAGVEVSQLSPLHRESRQLHILSSEQIVRFLIAARHCDSEKIRALALLVFFTGITSGECAGLNLEDVNLDEFHPHIVVRAPRGKSRKIYPLNVRTRQALAEWIASRNLDGQSALNQPLFVNDRHDQRLTTSGLDCLIRQLGIKHHLELSCRILRDTCLFNQRRIGSPFLAPVGSRRVIDKGVLVLGEHGEKVSSPAPHPDQFCPIQQLPNNVVAWPQ